MCARVPSSKRRLFGTRSVATAGDEPKETGDIHVGDEQRDIKDGDTAPGRFDLGDECKENKDVRELGDDDKEKTEDDEGKGIGLGVGSDKACETGVRSGASG
jgi:hypothetical protein